MNVDQFIKFLQAFQESQTILNNPPNLYKNSQIQSFLLAFFKTLVRLKTCYTTCRYHLNSIAIAKYSRHPHIQTWYSQPCVAVPSSAIQFII